MNQGLGQLEPLLHAGGIFFQPAIAGVFQAQTGQHFVGPPQRLLARHAIEFAGQGHVLGSAQSGDQGISLGHVTEQAPQQRAAAGEVVAEHPAASLRGRQQAKQDLEQRRLAAAVGPEQTDPPRLKAQRNIAQGVVLAVPAVDAVKFDEHVE